MSETFVCEDCDEEFPIADVKKTEDDEPVSLCVGCYNYLRAFCEGYCE